MYTLHYQTSLQPLLLMYKKANVQIGYVIPQGVKNCGKFENQNSFKKPSWLAEVRHTIDAKVKKAISWAIFYLEYASLSI